MSRINMLIQLGNAYGTDKGDNDHSFRGRSYLDIYDEHFRDMHVQTVLELGVLHGRSLKMWRDYFGVLTQIWGVDLNPEAKQDYGERIQVVIGPQDDRATLDRVAPGKRLDIVIDDGSHLVDHILGSFDILWPRVSPGGYYCIEDLCFSYADIAESKRTWPGQNLNPEGTNYVNDRSKFNTVIQNLIQEMDYKHGPAQAVHFYSNQCLIQKMV